MIDLLGYFTEDDDCRWLVKCKLSRLENGELVWVRDTINHYVYITSGTARQIAKQDDRILIYVKGRPFHRVGDGGYMVYLESDLWLEEEQKTDITADE